MNSSDDMTFSVTCYSSPYVLTVLASRSSSGRVHGLSLADDGAGGALALFLSPLDAEMYRQRLVRLGGVDWRLRTLARFDVTTALSHANQRLDCALVFGFAAQPPRCLATLPTGALAPAMMTQSFARCPRRAAPGTLRFASRMMIYIESEWARLGGRRHGDALPAVHALAPDALARLAGTALAGVETSMWAPRGEYWMFFDAAAEQWRFGLTERAQGRRFELVRR